MWNKWLGLSASLLAGRTNRVPPECSLVRGNIAHPVNQNLQILTSLKELQMYFPFTGWRASPALGAMQEPIPDLSWFLQKKENLYFLTSKKSDHMFKWSKGNKNTHEKYKTIHSPKLFDRSIDQTS